MRQWKVGTITMGILLVTIGIVSILSQNIGVSLIDAVLKWWPVALITLGIEVLLSSFLSKGDSVRLKFDGFSIFIIMLILLVTTGAYFVQNVIKGGIAGQIFNINLPSKYETRLTKNFSIPSDGKKKFILSNHQGDILVLKSSSGNIEIEAAVSIRNNDEEYSKSFLDSLFSIEEEAIVKIASVTDNLLKDRYKVQSITIDYIVKIPENIDIEVNNKFGKFNASDIINNLKITNSNGDIDISKISGNIQISNRFGKIRVNTVTGNADVDGSNGDILLRDIGGYGKITNKFGRIDLYNVQKKVDINNSNGAIYVDNDKIVEEDIFIQNKFGEITLKLPESQQGTFKCDTRFGKINSKFMINIVEEHGSSQSGSGTIGNGKVNIKVDNSNGNINLYAR